MLPSAKRAMTPPRIPTVACESAKGEGKGRRKGVSTGRTSTDGLREQQSDALTLRCAVVRVDKHLSHLSGCVSRFVMSRKKCPCRVERVGSHRFEVRYRL